MPIEFDGPNSKVSADTIAGQGGSTITIQSGHSLSGSGSGLTALPAANLTGTLPAISGVNLTALNATNLGSGTVPDARFPSTLPAASGANLTALNATNLASGTVATARLGSGTANNGVFLRGDGTWAAAGGGKILQVVQAVKTDVMSTQSTSFIDIPSLSATITPSATTSKILITGSVSYGGQNGATIKINLVRGSTNVVVGDASGGNPESVYANYAVDHTHATFSFSPMYIDSPNSTSALTYKLQIKGEGSPNYAFINRCQEDSATQHSRNVSTLIVMEIGV